MLVGGFHILPWNDSWIITNIESTFLLTNEVLDGARDSSLYQPDEFRNNTTLSLQEPSCCQISRITPESLSVQLFVKSELASLRCSLLLPDAEGVRLYLEPSQTEHLSSWITNVVNEQVRQNVFHYSYL